MCADKYGRMLAPEAPTETLVTFDRDPASYRHWRMAVDGRVATLSLDVDEDGGIRPGYTLKLNSYDLGVDIELHDALQRIRFEHPQVACVVLTSGKERTFSAGANIYMLGLSSHAWKVNFCKFTNETRNGMEDSSRHDGLRFLAAVNGSCAGGGYEVALACDEIAMIDDRSTAVSLPEVPLLGVLPGTGGLTRVVGKRGVRRDLADVFCTNADGVRAQRAKEWKLVDHIAPPSSFAALVGERAAELAAASPRSANATGVALTPLRRTIDDVGYHYEFVDATFDRTARTVTLMISAPESIATSPTAIEAAGAQWWPLQMARELDDALLMLRTNERELGTILVKTRGSSDAVLALGAALVEHRDHWFVRETIGMLRRTFARFDVTSRSFYALIDAGSCFVGPLFELALAADRSFMLASSEADAPTIALDATNAGLFPTVAGTARLAARFNGAPPAIDATRYDADAALAAGLITVAPDDLDWDDEVRVAIEERAAFSPDAMTALEANLRFGGNETDETKIFGRLSAWQNWVFNRPNSTGEHGALRIFGSGSKPHFSWERV